MDSLFQPPAEQWHRLDPAYQMVRMVGSLITNIVVWAAPVGIAWFFLRPWAWLAVLAAALVWTLWRVARARRYARSYGYAERGEDLCITRGLWFKELTVVPYGRLQVAKVDAGPVDQLFKLATVTLVTASAQSNATIPGLPMAEATKLRDRLIEVGDTRGAGM